MSERYVLDSFAILALLGKEPGNEVVRQLLGQAEAGQAAVLMTWVNVGEVAYIVERRWGKGRVYQVLGALEATAVEMKTVGRDLALTAAEIKAGHQLAYADAFAAALAIREEAVLVTGDPEFRQLEQVLPLEWLPGTEHNHT
ncbi:MAG: PIN domain-containing protein [Anaerolineae bacterium]